LSRPVNFWVRSRNDYVAGRMCISHALVKKGFPGEEILKAIQAKEVDLAVLGTRGYSKATGFLLGSVSQWVLQEAPCSVLIARNMPREKKNVQGLKLLLATDGSRDSQAAVDFLQASGVAAFLANHDPAYRPKTGVPNRTGVD
jgi:hypothetical protein